MPQLVVFSKTAHGYLHRRDGRPCEDWSGASVDQDGVGLACAVADGHGDPSCVRSAQGARMAVEAALSSLGEFASAMASPDSIASGLTAESLKTDRGRELAIRHLTDAIVGNWSESVRCDLEQRPLTEDELGLVGAACAERYRAGESLEHAYGTTLIAAQRLSISGTGAFLVLLQQGDGRCDVFYRDGRVDQPIPWDDRCFENVTTSLCDPDVSTSFRGMIIDLAECDVAACFLETDGVEDSYPDMEGVHLFNRRVARELSERGPKGLAEYLDGWLGEFSRNGSGDDVSIAGIVDLAGIEVVTRGYDQLSNAYELGVSLAEAERKLKSMERRHDALRARMREAEEEFAAYDAQYKEVARRRDEVEARIRELRAQAEAPGA